eukprot:NODE_2678_length_757_cov_88.437853_g1291_i1.p6 GENE.NODE_2678_length_757_cov_88.437853_g1291_i1~~NODE_2678_length_757_cov_88.437853_g1291_i1.p6  ORF type:complete len:61 (+),score=0.94 NODE_2678_length_757_cov_88.437853_g1291_i1:183-365(+)
MTAGSHIKGLQSIGVKKKPKIGLRGSILGTCAASLPLTGLVPRKKYNALDRFRRNILMPI